MEFRLELKEKLAKGASSKYNMSCQAENIALNFVYSSGKLL